MKRPIVYDWRDWLLIPVQVLLVVLCVIFGAVCALLLFAITKLDKVRGVDA